MLALIETFIKIHFYMKEYQKEIAKISEFQCHKVPEFFVRCRRTNDLKINLHLKSDFLTINFELYKRELF